MNHVLVPLKRRVLMLKREIASVDQQPNDLYRIAKLHRLHRQHAGYMELIDWSTSGRMYFRRLLGNSMKFVEPPNEPTQT